MDERTTEPEWDTTEVTMASLVWVIDNLRFQQDVRGFVCTPATFRKLREFGAKEKMEFEMTTGRRRPTPTLLDLMVGIPVRVEEDPQPQAGEVVLTLP